MNERGKYVLNLLRGPGVLTDELRRELMELLIFPPEKRRMSYEEFLEWADEDTLAEWVDGEVIMYSPASDRHQDLVRFLSAVLSIYVEVHESGVIRPAPFQMKLAHSGREPDLMFVARGHLDRLKETHLDGPADLVVEVVSPESVRRDRGEKFYEYQEAGIPEYWLIDPDEEWAEFWVLKPSGRYHLAMEGREGEYRSQAIEGFWLRVEWLWQKPLPSVDEVMLEIGGEVYARRLIERLREQGFLS